jgi:putative IMPACT (imprinted ancient) family translation regulator
MAWRWLKRRSTSNNNAADTSKISFEIVEGSDDDGEAGGGRTILKVLRKLGVADVFVVVARWYGGIMLGPYVFLNYISLFIANCNVI